MKIYRKNYGVTKGSGNLLSRAFDNGLPTIHVIDMATGYKNVEGLINP